MRRAGIFTETNIYFYLHKEIDKDVIEQVNILKKNRKLNSLIISLLKEHFKQQRHDLLSNLKEIEEELGYLPEL
jgi:hypothetical protein